MTPQKIFIIGISGSGKSTLAKELSEKLKIPKYDLDDIFWIKKYSVKKNDKICEAELKELIKKEKTWVIEGVFDWAKIAAEKADIIIWLNYHINIATLSVIKRKFEKNREHKETIKELLALINYIRKYKKSRKPNQRSTHDRQQEIAHSNKEKLFEAKNRKQLKQIIEKITK